MLDPAELEVHSRAGTYSVTVGDGSFARLAATDNQLVIADERFASLMACTFATVILIEASEQQKTVSYADHLLGRLHAAGATRDTRLLAVGGGVVQDMATFVASIYMRGLPWSYAPTTLTAMADACIGGKSSLNVNGIKNLAGNFYPPVAIAVDPMFLPTLSDEQIACGLAEAAKIAYCRGAEEFTCYLELCQCFLQDRSSAPQLLRHVLSAKRWFVEVDEHDRAERRLLNFGHTFGHAIEAATSFTIPHGVAVALGMMCAVDLVPTADPVVGRLRAHCLDLLGRVPGLSSRLLELDIDRFARSFRADKKHHRSELHLILPKHHGGVSEVAMPDNAETWRAVSTVVEHVVSELAS